MVDMKTLLDPFLSQVPSGFNTGLIRQFAPRINSTATINNDINDLGFPKNCQEENNSFYAAYNYSVGDPTMMGHMEFSMEACMPEDQTHMKWSNTWMRQDFEEILYLKILTNASNIDPGMGQTLYQVKLNTTAGFFELPNYAHTEPGSLLDYGPRGSCGQDCARQVPLPTSYHERQASTNLCTNTMFNRESTPNKGPLLTTALALFGEGSFIADRFYKWESYIIPRSAGNTRHDPYHCQEMVPFAGLMAFAGQGDASLINNDIANCAPNTYLFDKAAVYQQIFDYLQFFQDESPQLPNAFSAAAYLANEAWLLHPSGGSTSCTLTIKLDHGTNSQKPSISLAGIVAISILLSAFLLGLLAIALYSSQSPRWTSQLNSFAMIRIGSSLADQISLKLVNDVENFRVLDKIPGNIGSETSSTADADDLRLEALVQAYPVQQSRPQAFTARKARCGSTRKTRCDSPGSQF